jgi:hypothetical protein
MEGRKEKGKGRIEGITDVFTIDLFYFILFLNQQTSIWIKTLICELTSLRLHCSTRFGLPFKNSIKNKIQFAGLFFDLVNYANIAEVQRGDRI